MGAPTVPTQDGGHSPAGAPPRGGTPQNPGSGSGSTTPRPDGSRPTPNIPSQRPQDRPAYTPRPDNTQNGRPDPRLPRPDADRPGTVPSPNDRPHNGPPAHDGPASRRPGNNPPVDGRPDSAPPVDSRPDNTPPANDHPGHDRPGNEGAGNGIGDGNDHTKGSNAPTTDQHPDNRPDPAADQHPDGRPEPTPASETRNREHPGGLEGPTDEHQQHVEDSIPRDENGAPQRHPDPDDGNWLDSINHPGPDAPGRNNNCVDSALAAADTYSGNPTAAAHRTPDHNPDGTPSDRGESNGRDRIENTLGGRFHDYGDGNDAFHRLENDLHNSGHGSQAVIITQDRNGRAHAWNAVNHHGTVTYVDAQTGQRSNTPLHNGDNGVHAIPLDPDRRPVHDGSQHGDSQGSDSGHDGGSRHDDGSGHDRDGQGERRPAAEPAGSDGNKRERSPGDMEIDDGDHTKRPRRDEEDDSDELSDAPSDVDMSDADDDHDDDHDPDGERRPPTDPDDEHDGDHDSENSDHDSDSDDEYDGRLRDEPDTTPFSASRGQELVDSQQQDWDDSDLGRMVERARLDHEYFHTYAVPGSAADQHSGQNNFGLAPSANYAAFRYVVEPGSTEYVMLARSFGTSGNVTKVDDQPWTGKSKHSERAAIEYLQHMQSTLPDGQRIRVTEVYTERAPCAQKGCASLMYRVLGKVPTTHTLPHPDDGTGAREMRNHLNDLKQRRQEILDDDDREHAAGRAPANAPDSPAPSDDE
ncbi:toxin glutamine deamidase domain-containing protein [Streptomyces kronopolitis]|nr:toxin glutamine deamidase domain-containing protein [Streptomyces kronopolitis]